MELSLSSVPERHAHANTRGPLRSRQRILVIEDNQDGAESLRMLLSILGHEVAVAYTGTEGVRAALEWRPEIVLCDIGLPGLDGFGVAQALRRHPATAGAILIAMTGYGGEAERCRSQAVGFAHHLVKPVDPQALIPLLANTQLHACS